MAIFNAPTSTLQNIMNKVRKLTRRPSVAQLSDQDLVDYINTFIRFDIPEILRPFNLETTFTFTCNPFQDVYPLDILSYGISAAANNNPLYNFINNYNTISQPVYIAGFQSLYSQSRTQFFGIYPNINSILSIGQSGDGILTNFSGVINLLNNAVFPQTNVTQLQNTVLLKNNVLFESVDLNGNALSMVDVPCLDATTGNPTIWGNLYPIGQTPVAPNLPQISNYSDPLNNNLPDAVFQNNYINYFTGQFVVTFPFAPAAGQPINSQTVPVQTSMPQALLFYNNKFTVRPVPDQPYRIQFQCYQNPSVLFDSQVGIEEQIVQPQGTNPDGYTSTLAEFWQLYAYGAAKKIFEDSMDLESVQMIMPEFTNQMCMMERRTLVQYATQRSSTIYTEQTGHGSGYGGWGIGGGNGGQF